MDNWNNKQKITTQIVCLLLSIGLWFYVVNVENPVMSQDINKVPVRLLNEGVLRDSNLIISPNQQFYVNLKIEATSQDLRKISRDDFDVVVDLSEYVFKVGENKLPVHIIDSPSRAAIKNNNSLTLTINIEEYVEEDFKVTSNINIIAKPSYYVAPIEFKDETVKVSGAKSLIDRVASVVAKGEEFNVSETITNNYNLYAVDENGEVVEGVTLSQSMIEATIKINEGKVVPIHVNTIGELKPGLRLVSIMQDYKEVELSGPEDILYSIAMIETENIDLSNITDNTNIEVPLRIPNNVQANLGQLNSITVTINVEKENSKELSVPVAFEGIAEGLILDGDNKVIKVKVTGYAEDIKDITEASIVAKIDLSNYTEVGEFTESPVVSLITPNDKVRLESVDKVTFNILKVNEAPVE